MDEFTSRGKPLKVAVTGGRGFIGRHVVKQLVQLGANVHLILRPGPSSEIDIADIAPKTKAISPRIRVCKVDLGDQNLDVHAACGSPDVLVHLAWAGLPNYQSRHHLDSELPLHAEFISAAFASGTPHVVAIGTCFEYGVAEGILNETLPTRPTTVYAEAKVRLHDQIRQAADVAGMNLTWLRPFYAFGLGQPATTLWGQLHDAMERGDLEFPMSFGEQRRDYLEVAKMGALIAEVAVRPSASEPVLNICSGYPTRVLDLVRQWVSANDSPIRLSLGARPYSPDEPMDACGSVRRLESHLQKHVSSYAPAHV